MSKEEILYKHLSEAVTNAGEEMVSMEDAQKETMFEICISAMQEYADQEKEKVAVAFTEWKENNVLSDGRTYHPVCCTTVFDNITELYQYFINNVYNK